MKRIRKTSDEYLQHHATQVAVIGEQGQQRLAEARVHVSGLGRVGHQVVLLLAAAGVGIVPANDPQSMEPENFGAFVFARRPDRGREKAFVLERFFDGRPDFLFEPVVARTESAEVDPYIARSDLVISCANTVSGRLAAEAKAIRYGKTVMQVAAFDHRELVGGLITIRRPNRNEACFGCFLDGAADFSRGEGLLSTATAALAAIAANMAVQLLTGQRAGFITEHNVFFVDLEKYAIDALAVVPSPECTICGEARTT